ncbi:Hypothetical predicted protein [Olea europaea subsp. europaea]|uniref:Uncharacterized protein n=1 Tax=Olea europaea subsp. europaea TaxID=158383 RepID=A0A8S0TVF7_OLEEU|nr:Hypothetical predicted protein [Olea europaea subsp. europaea]
MARIIGFYIDDMPVIRRDCTTDEYPNICNELLLSPRFLYKKNKCDIILKELLYFKDISPYVVEKGLDPWANITDKGPSQKTGVHEIHVEYQTPVEQYEVGLNYFVDDLHGLSLGTYGGASTIDGGPSQETEVGKSHNEEQTPTMQHEVSPNFAVNADGMRRGKKVKITPSLLGPYEVAPASYAEMT